MGASWPLKIGLRTTASNGSMWSGGGERTARPYGKRTALVVELGAEPLAARVLGVRDASDEDVQALVRLLASQPDRVALYGCPRGSLCSELDKQDNDLAQPCRELMHTPIDWIEQQFKAMGRRDARDLAFALLASYEGMALLADVPGLDRLELTFTDRLTAAGFAAIARLPGLVPGGGRGGRGRCCCRGRCTRPTRPRALQRRSRCGVRGAR